MIIKRKHSGSFAVIPNAISNDEKLKADTLGVLVYLLAKPEDWKVSVADLRRRFHMGRNRVYEIILELEVAAYVKRFQNRAAGNRFSAIEYHIYDCPQATAVQATHEDEKPLPGIGETEKPQQNPASLISASPPTVCGNQGHILKTDLTKSLREENSAEAGEVSPSVNQEVWKEGVELLKTTSLNPNRSIIGKWLKRSSTKKDGKEKLLGMIRAAAKAGTLDPVAYIAKAVDSEFGPLPQPRQFDTATWQRNIQAAIKTKDWPQAWGPAPGKKGCLVPTDLITAELTGEFSGWKSAA